MKKRIFRDSLLMLLITVMLCQVLVGCSDDVEPEVTTPAVNEARTDTPAGSSEPEETEYTPDIPDVKYDGYTVKVLQRAENCQYYAENFIYSGEVSGDPIKDAVYRRNSELEEKFGIRIVSEEAGNNGETAQKYESGVNSGDDEYTLVIAQATSMAKTAAKGLFLNVSELPYANIDAEYWSKKSLEGLEIKGKRYLFQNDVSFTALHYSRGTIFNTYLVDEYKLDNPYSLVEKNEWTLDKFLQLASSVSADMNGDQVYNANDRFGFISEPASIGYLLAGCGVSLSGLDQDGNRYITLVDDGAVLDRTVDVITRFREYLADPTKSLSYADAQATAQYAGGQWIGGRKLFSEDHFLFLYAGAAVFDELASLNMSNEYGIVPMPKYTSDQEDYRTSYDQNSNIFAIPSYKAEELEKISVILEYWAFLSEKTVKPQYYDLHVKTKRAYGARFGEMMDIIKNSVTYEFTNVYGVGVYDTVVSAMSNSGPASFLTASLKPMKNNIKQINEQFAAMN